MNFIDKTGHVFTMPSYESKPLDKNYDLNSYIFWFNDGRKISVKNFSIIPIRLLVKSSSYNKIRITCDSNIYSLIGSTYIQEQSELISNLSDYVELDKTCFKQTLELSDDADDLLEIELIEDNHEFTLIPFYVICYGVETGTLLSNVLIDILDVDGYHEYCSISVGAIFTDECEELVINGKNMGISLPKDILRAIYQTSYYNDIPDENLYNEKIKEYLLNYMEIKGQCGNYKSVLSSLKWFGWGNKITISTLLKTDNEFCNQYILDYFDIQSDVIETYRNFKQSTFINLYIEGNVEVGQDEHNFNNEFWGEAHPIMKNLLDTNVSVEYDEGDIHYYKPYYKYMFNELLLKLACLKYYYQKYFLPIHLKIKTASLRHKCYTNDIKFVTVPYVKITEKVTNLIDYDIKVLFPNANFIYFEKSTHLIDDNYNEFNYYSETTNESLYFVNENCLTIPIKFISVKDEQFYNCSMIVTINDNYDDPIINKNFSFVQRNNEPNTFYSNFIIIPRLFKYLYMNEHDTYKISLRVNDKWFYYSFKLKIPNIYFRFGKLRYKYAFDTTHKFISDAYSPDNILTHNINTSLFRQINTITDNGVNFNAFMYDPELVTTNEIDFIFRLHNYGEADRNGIIMYGDTDTSEPDNRPLTDNIDTFLYYLYNKSIPEGTDTYKRNYINDMINDKYTLKLNISSNRKYLNRIHLFDLYKKTDEKIDKKGRTYNTYEKFKYINKYVKGETEYNKDIISLYRSFFKDNGSYKFYPNELIQYDYYLMHDTEYWYIVYISTLTMDNITKEQENIIQRKNNEVNFDEFKLKYVSSDNKFLVNRMQIIDVNGVHHFNDDDVIVIYTESDNMQNNIEISSKWIIEPLSLNTDVRNNIALSNTNIGIISLGEGNNKYESGYYNATINYSIEGLLNNVNKQIAKFKIN